VEIAEVRTHTHKINLGQRLVLNPYPTQKEDNKIQLPMHVAAEVAATSITESQGMYNYLPSAATFKQIWE